MSDDSAIFFPSDRLGGLFTELQDEFENQVDELLTGPIAEDDKTLKVDRAVFMEGFTTHIHRYQQMFLMLRDIGLLKNSMLEVNFLTALAVPGYEPGMMLPVIRQHDDFMYVGFEEPPVDLSTIEKRDAITIATVPLLPGDPPPYNGRSVLVTTVDAETEVALVSHDTDRNKVVLMWGDYVMDEVNRQEPIKPETLN